MSTFCEAYTEEKKLTESIKEAKWKKHFSDFGRYKIKLNFSSMASAILLLVSEVFHYIVQLKYMNYCLMVCQINSEVNYGCYFLVQYI